jgi:hypothetical protein
MPPQKHDIVLVILLWYSGERNQAIRRLEATLCFPNPAKPNEKLTSDKGSVFMR